MEDVLEGFKWVVTLQCQMCDEEATGTMKDLIRDGWLVINGNCSCPECTIATARGG